MRMIFWMRFIMYKNIPQPCLLTEQHGLRYTWDTEGRLCYAVSSLFNHRFSVDDRSVAAGRSSRIYEENVQYDDRTDKKLKGFLLHTRTPPFRRRPRGKKGADRQITRCPYILGYSIADYDGFCPSSAAQSQKRMRKHPFFAVCSYFGFTAPSLMRSQFFLR